MRKYEKHGDSARHWETRNAWHGQISCLPDGGWFCLWARPLGDFGPSRRKWLGTYFFRGLGLQSPFVGTKTVWNERKTGWQSWHWQKRHKFKVWMGREILDRGVGQLLPTMAGSTWCLSCTKTVAITQNLQNSSKRWWKSVAAVVYTLYPCYTTLLWPWSKECSDWLDLGKSLYRLYPSDKPISLAVLL